MADKRESVRVKDGQQMRILDEAARRRRQRKALEALEQDNFSDDPHADLKMSKKAPKFEEVMDPASTGASSKKKRKSKGDFKLRYRKNFAALLEEEHMLNREGPSYLTACAPPSKWPERHFCAICGFPSTYTCVQCGARYCCIRCLGTHQDTSFANDQKYGFKNLGETQRVAVDRKLSESYVRRTMSQVYGMRFPSSPMSKLITNKSLGSLCL